MTKIIWTLAEHETLINWVAFEGVVVTNYNSCDKPISYILCGSEPNMTH